MSNDTHKCPAPDCDLRVPFQRLACSRHWYVISEPTRRKLLRLWASDFGSDEYFEARAQCLLELGVPIARIASENGGIGLKVTP